MGKLVKKLATAIAIAIVVVAIGVATGGAGLASFGFLTLEGVAAVVAAGAVLGALSVAAAEFVAKPTADLGSAKGRLNVSLDPNAHGKWVFGETACATDLIYAERIININDDDIFELFSAASHLIDSFGDLHLNDELITFTGLDADGAWNGILKRHVRLGTESQTSIIPTGSIHPVLAQGKGIAQFGFVYNVNEGQKTKLSGGRVPSRVTQEVKGAPVYDPRLDSTRGGTGAHRANDQSTWEFTNTGTDIGKNWALIVLFYLIGWRNNGELVFGVGADLEDIDYAQAIAAANICEELDGGDERFFIGGILPTTNDHEKIIGELEGAIGGKVSRIGGKYFIWAPNDDLVSSGTITNGDLVVEVGIEFSPSADLDILKNTARGSYISPPDLYQSIPYPDIVETTAVTDDGRDRILDHNFALIQDKKRAERVARMLVRRSRFTGTWRFAAGPKGLLHQVFDIITINFPETNDTDTLVRVVNMEYGPQGIVAMEVLEEDTSIYDISAPLGSAITQLDPATFDPTTKIAVSGLAAVAKTLTGSASTATDAIKVTWNDPGGLVAETEVQFKVDIDADWQSVPPEFSDFLQAIASPVESGTTYDVRARHITVVGVIGDWAATIQVVAGTNATSAAIVDQGELATEDNIGQDRGGLGNLNYNGDMRLQRLLAGGTARPAGVYRSDTTTDPKYEDAARTQLLMDASSDATIRHHYTAFKVEANKKYTVFVRAKARSAVGSGFYIRMSELDSAIPEGKQTLGSANTPETEVALWTRENASVVPAKENIALGDTFEEHTVTYTPTATAEWAALQIIDWTGAGNVDFIIDLVAIETQPGDLYAVDEAEVDALALVNAPAEAGADVTADHGDTVSLDDDGAGNLEVRSRRILTVTGGAPIKNLDADLEATQGSDSAWLPVKDWILVERRGTVRVKAEYQRATGTVGSQQPQFRVLLNTVSQGAVTITSIDPAWGSQHLDVVLDAQSDNQIVIELRAGLTTADPEPIPIAVKIRNAGINTDVTMLDEVIVGGLGGSPAHNHDASDITSSTFADARIAESNVTQHEAALTLIAAQIPSLDTSKITTGAFADARIPSLAASKITSGVFADARIPSLDTGKITTGVFVDARIPSLAASKITSGTFADARIAASNVTQHQAALTITESQISDLTHAVAALNDIGDVTLETPPTDNEVLAYSTASGEWHNQTPFEAGLAPATHLHGALDVVSGVFAVARIPDLDAAKITTGTFAAARIPTHTGHVTGQTSLTVVAAAITGQTALASGLAGADELLVSDSGVIKRMDISVMNAYFNGALDFSATGHTHTGTTISALDAGDTTTGTFAAARIPTHTGHVTGQTSLSVVVAAITGQTALTTGLAGTDELLLSDAGVIKRMDISVMNAYFNANLAFNNYVHPGHPGDDFSVDSGVLGGATVISDIDINVTTDSEGHVTDANGVIATRALTAANIGAAAASHSHSGADITSGTVADARLPTTQGGKTFTGNISAPIFFVGGDDGIRTVTGSFGNVQTTGSGVGGWEGYSITGRVVFMHDGGTSSGLYNDVNNQWLINCVNLAAVTLYYSGTGVARTALNTLGGFQIHDTSAQFKDAGFRQVKWFGRSGSYTVTRNEQQEVINCTATLTITLPSSSAIPDGAVFYVRSDTTGTVTVDAASGVVLQASDGTSVSSGSKTITTRYAWVTVVKESLNLFSIFGDFA